MSRIALGNIAKDVVTGIQGTVICITTELNGNRRICIQQPVKDEGALPEAYDHDEVGVDFVSEGHADRVVPAASTPIKLGDKVRDIAVEAFEGVVIARIDYMNGCTRFNVAGGLNRNLENTICQIDHARLRVVGTVIEAAATPQTRTGGPLTRSNALMRPLRRS